MVRRSVVLLLVISTVLAAGLAWQRRDPLEYVRIMESAERVKKLQVARVIEQLQLEKGQRIADLGAASGLFSRPMARQVGSDGIVYAVDIDEDLLRYVEETAREERLQNLRTVLASEFDPRIPEPVDLIFICDTLHEIKNPAGYLRNLPQYLRAAGRVAVIDYEKNWPSRLNEAKYSLAQLEQWMRAAGFHRAKEFNFLEDNFFVIYRYHPPAN